jgi:hypothetical protein
VGAETRDGVSECSWYGKSAKGFKSLSLQFYDKAYIASSPSETIDAFFQMMAEPAGDEKMSPLEGIGVRAVLVTADPQAGAYVQLGNGVVRIVTNNLTRSQVAAVARAVATP